MSLSSPSDYSAHETITDLLINGFTGSDFFDLIQLIKNDPIKATTVTSVTICESILDHDTGVAVAKFVHLLSSVAPHISEVKMKNISTRRTSDSEIYKSGQLIIISFFYFFKNLRKLKIINCRFIVINQSIISIIFALVRHSVTLETLSIENCGISDIYGGDIVSLVSSVNCPLTEFNLSGNEFSIETLDKIISSKNAGINIIFNSVVDVAIPEESESSSDSEFIASDSQEQGDSNSSSDESDSDSSSDDVSLVSEGSDLDKLFDD